jgi:hypothetical protein
MRPRGVRHFASPSPRKRTGAATARRRGPIYLSPLRQPTFFDSRFCRCKAELIRFGVDCRHCTAEFGSYFMRRPISYQELPKRFLFVFSPTIGMCCQEWTSLLRLQPICGRRSVDFLRITFSRAARERTAAEKRRRSFISPSPSPPTLQTRSRIQLLLLDAQGTRDGRERCLRVV